MYSLKVIPVLIEGIDGPLYCARYVSNDPFVSELLDGVWYTHSMMFLYIKDLVTKCREIKLMDRKRIYMSNPDPIWQDGTHLISCHNPNSYDILIYLDSYLKVIFNSGRIFICVYGTKLEIVSENVYILANILRYKSNEIASNYFARYNISLPKSIRHDFVYHRHKIQIKFYEYHWEIYTTYMCCSIPDFYLKLYDKIMSIEKILDSFTIKVSDPHSLQCMCLTLEEISERLLTEGRISVINILSDSNTELLSLDHNYASMDMNIVNILYTIFSYLIQMPKYCKRAIC